MAQVEVACQWCGVVFVSSRRTTRACSARCRRALRTAQVTVGLPCAGGCGTVLVDAHEARLYCSNRCREAAKKRRQRSARRTAERSGERHGGEQMSAAERSSSGRVDTHVPVTGDGVSAQGARAGEHGERSAERHGDGRASTVTSVSGQRAGTVSAHGRGHERSRERRALRDVLTLHEPRTGERTSERSPICRECERAWPCPTRVLATTGLGVTQ